MRTLQQLSLDPGVSAILLQLPLDSTNQIDADRCTNTIHVNKVHMCPLRPSERVSECYPVFAGCRWTD